VLELLVELGHAVLEQHLLTVHLHRAVALANDLLEEIFELALAVAHDRRV